MENTERKEPRTLSIMLENEEPIHFIIPDGISEEWSPDMISNVTLAFYLHKTMREVESLKERVRILQKFV